MESKEEKIASLLSRNVEGVIEKDHLEAALYSGKKLRIKFGIDPTSPDLHLGHAVVLRKLREFQNLGHLVMLVIGDFTAQIGDPSGRSQTRRSLSASEVKKNEKEYLRHAGKILDLKKIKLFHNNDWFGKQPLGKIIQLTNAASLQQVLRREDFQKRMARDEDITLLEILYPLFQGYDSVQMKADVELGGTDQLFNLMMGRRIKKQFDMPEQDIMTLPLLVGLDGEKKMSKSYGNYIGLDDTPSDMFGKMMSLPDPLVEKYFLLCTDIPEKEIAEFRKTLGPKELKERLGFEIVKLYHSEKAAREARENFEKIFSRKEIPNDIPELKIKEIELTALDLAMQTGTQKSRSDARRLIEQGGFEYDGAVIKDAQSILSINDGAVLRVGKKNFFRTKLKG
jgi:tyrosyl-tRNA synthetase